MKFFSRAINLAAILAAIVGNVPTLAQDVSVDFEGGTLGEFPNLPWVPASTEIAGSNAVVPSTVIIETTGADGQATKAAQIVDSFGESAGALFDVVSTNPVRLVSDFRIDQYADMPGNGILNWITLGVFQKDPTPDFNNNPQATVFACKTDNHFRIYFDNGEGRFGNFSLGGPEITLGTWYRVEFNLDKPTGFYDVKIFDSATNTLFTSASGIGTDNWDPTFTNYDAVAFLKGPSDPNITSQGTVATIDNLRFDAPVCMPASAPSVGPIAIAKNRYLSFLAGDLGRVQSIRVRFVDLPTPYDLWNGTVLWVSAPSPISERGALADATQPTFNGATLQCQPALRDWSAERTIHVFHEGIVAGGRYQIDVLDATCSALDSKSFSASIEIVNSEFGDLVAGFNDGVWPAPNGQVDIVSDVIAVLQGFQSHVSAPSKTRTDVEPCRVDHVLNISDAIVVLNAFSGKENTCTPSVPTLCP